MNIFRICLQISLVIASLAASRNASARVFDFKSEAFAPYIKATFGRSSIGKSAYEEASGADTEFASAPQTNFTGEFGFLLSMSNMVGVRIFIDVIQAMPMRGISGKSDDGATTYLNLTSTLLTYSPSAAFEIYFFKSQTSRAFAYLGLGLAQTTLKNEYDVTAAGQAYYTLNASYTEQAVANSMNIFGGVGYEFLMSDTATVSFDMGYRYLPIGSFTHSEDGETIAQGAVSSGDTLKNADGSTRTFDLSTLFVGVALRIYIQ